MRSIPKNGKPHQRKPFMRCFVFVIIASFTTLNLLYYGIMEEKETQLLDLSSILPPEQQQQQQQQKPVKTNGNHDKNTPLSEVTTKVSVKAKRVENEASRKAISTLSQAIDGDSNNGNQEQPRFAYVFLIAGCIPNKPGSYKGYIYNVMIAKELLTKRYNSQSQVE
jgi:hypothetical protein